MTGFRNDLLQILRPELTEVLLGVFRKTCHYSFVDPTSVDWSFEATSTNMVKINAFIIAEKRYIDLIEENLLKKNHPAQVIFIDRLYNETSANPELRIISIELKQNINFISVEDYEVIELSCDFSSNVKKY